VIKLAASSLHMITSYVLLLFLLGAGSPWTFGTGAFTLSGTATGQGAGTYSVSVVVVSTFIALALGVAVALKITQRVLKYSEAKKMHRRDSVGAGARWCPKCGAENAMNAKFCEKCGTTLQVNLSPAGRQT
jgi:membrane protease subunit (stomatin/prohibitin family)